MSRARLTACLLPGLDGTGRLYSALVQAMGDRFHTRVLEYPRERFDGYASLANLLAPQLPTDAPFVLVAESFAGPLGVLLAHRRPAQLKALVLAATFVRAPVPASMLVAGLVERVPLPMPPALLMRGLLAGRDAPAGLQQELDAVLAGMPMRIARDRAVAALRVDVRRELSELDIPVLYLQAMYDRLIRQRAGAEVMRCARRAELMRIHAPHFLFQRAPDDAVDAMRFFLSTHIDG